MYLLFYYNLRVSFEKSNLKKKKMLKFNLILVFYFFKQPRHQTLRDSLFEKTACL